MPCKQILQCGHQQKKPSRRSNRSHDNTHADHPVTHVWTDLLDAINWSLHNMIRISYVIDMCCFNEFICICSLLKPGITSPYQVYKFKLGGIPQFLPMKNGPLLIYDLSNNNRWGWLIAF